MNNSTERDGLDGPLRDVQRRLHSQHFGDRGVVVVARPPAYSTLRHPAARMTRDYKGLLPPPFLRLQGITPPSLLRLQGITPPSLLRLQGITPPSLPKCDLRRTRETSTEDRTGQYSPGEPSLPS